MDKVETQNESERDLKGQLYCQWNTASSNKNGVDKIEPENGSKPVSQGKENTSYTTSLDGNDIRKVEVKNEPEQISKGPLSWSDICKARASKNGVDKEGQPERVSQGALTTYTTSLDGNDIKKVETKNEPERVPKGPLSWSNICKARANKNGVDKVEPKDEPERVSQGALYRQENTTYTTSLDENGTNAAKPKDEAEQYPRDALYKQFRIADPDSRVGRRIAAFYKLPTYNVMEDLVGAENYVEWSDDVLVYIPDRCRQILEDREAQAPDKDTEAVIMWEALDEWLYRYIWKSLHSEVTVATIHPEPRSAYRLWSDLSARYGHSAVESGRRDLIQKLTQLRPTKADRKHDQIRHIVAKLVKLGYDFDDGVLGGLFDRSVPEMERIEAALATSSKLVVKADHWVVGRMAERVFSRLASD